MTVATLQRFLALVFVALGVAVCRGSIELGFVNYGTPASGLFPFAAGILIVLAATVLLFSRPTEDDRSVPALTPAPVLFILATAGYFLLFDRLGTLVSTVLFMAVATLVLAREKPLTVVMAAAISVALIHFMFSVWLGTNLPHGILW